MDDPEVVTHLHERIDEYHRSIVTKRLEMEFDDVPEEAWAAYKEGGSTLLSEWKDERDFALALAALATDAHEAWATGSAVYSITVSAGLKAGSTQLGGGLISIQRNLGWERAVSTVLEAGWRLHAASQSSRASTGFHITDAFVSFVRPSDDTDS